MNPKRVFFYVLVVLASFLLQNGIFAASSLIDTTPNIMLIITFSFAFIRGEKEGMLIGFFSGLLLDLFFSDVIGFQALVYLLIGYFNGLLGKFFYVEFINMPVILCLLSDLIYGVYIYLFDFLVRGRTGFPAYFTGVIVPELAYTVVLTLVLYRLLRHLNDKVSVWEKRSAKEFV